MKFQAFPKIARWSREIVITEKLDGTNSQIYIAPEMGGVFVDDDMDPIQEPPCAVVDGLGLWAGSRNRWLTRQQDNFGFFKWVYDNAASLVYLGQGRHYGEWWGQGIQRGYGLQEKRFSLFNVKRWGFLAEEGFRDAVRRGVVTNAPSCCYVVPTLYTGMNEPGRIEAALAELSLIGSLAAPGFMDPEGIVVFHVAGNVLFKKTIHGDEKPKGLIEE